MKKLYTVPIACALVFAFATAPALAAENVTIKNAKTGISIGTKVGIKGSDPGLLFVTSSGNLECTENTVEGEVTNNGSGNATATITKATFLEEKGSCKTTTTLGRVEVSAKVSAAEPWTYTLNTEKQAILTHTSGVIAFSAHFTGGSGLNCEYTREEVLGKFKTGAGLVDTISAGQVFTKTTGSGTACPKEGTLEGAFTLTSGGEELEATV